MTPTPSSRYATVLVTVPGCGHAPALNTPRHFAWVRGFLAADDGR